MVGFKASGIRPARLMTHWFSPRELATKMGIWNISHSLGPASLSYFAVIWSDIAGDLLLRAGGIASRLRWLAFWLRDTPESLGLPPIEGTADLQHEAEPPSSFSPAVGVCESTYLVALDCQLFCLLGSLRSDRIGGRRF